MSTQAFGTLLNRMATDTKVDGMEAIASLVRERLKAFGVGAPTVRFRAGTKHDAYLDFDDGRTTVQAIYPGPGHLAGSPGYVAMRRTADGNLLVLIASRDLATALLKAASAAMEYRLAKDWGIDP